MIRANLADQRPFDLRSLFNGCRYCEIVLARKFDVVDAQNRTMCVVIEMAMVEIKWRLSS